MTREERVFERIVGGICIGGLGLWLRRRFGWCFHAFCRNQRNVDLEGRVLHGLLWDLDLTRLTAHHMRQHFKRRVRTTGDGAAMVNGDDVSAAVGLLALAVILPSMSYLAASR